MKSFAARLLAVVAACLLVLVGVAEAATLFTVAIVNGGGTPDVNCCVINVSTSAQTVQVQTLDPLGTVVADSGPVTIGPGTVFQAGVPLSAYYCKFITSGLPGDVRVSATVWNGTTGSIPTVFPAQ